jgi:Holliday junction resolvase
LYSSEARFSRALVDALTAKGIFHQRIESPETSAGIPDLYVRLPEHELWVELKNTKLNSIYANHWKVPWRKGQQAWARRYLRAAGAPCFTAMAVSDGFLWIPMHRLYHENIVYKEDCLQMTQLKDLIYCLTIQFVK